MISEYELLSDEDGFSGNLLGFGHFPNGVYFAVYEDDIVEDDDLSGFVIAYNHVGVHGLNWLIDVVLKELPGLAVSRDFYIAASVGIKVNKDIIGDIMAIDFVRELSRRGKSRVSQPWGFG
jgi:hypothetical protein